MSGSTSSILAAPLPSPEEPAAVRDWCQKATRELTAIVRRRDANENRAVHSIGRKTEQLTRTTGDTKLILAIPNVPAYYPHLVSHSQAVEMLSRLEEWAAQRTNPAVLTPALAEAEDTTTSPSPERGSSATRASESASLPEARKQDGTLTDRHIHLRGKQFNFTPKLREVLSYLLLNPNCHEEDVIRRCAFTDTGHLHKTLNDLRKRIGTELKREYFTLTIKTVERKISCTLRTK